MADLGFYRARGEASTNPSLRTHPGRITDNPAARSPELVTRDGKPVA
jgi:hypothetical protein